MGSWGHFAARPIVPGLLGLLLLPFGDPFPAEAGPKQWIGSNGDAWNDGTKWNRAGQPQAGDDVSLTQSGAANETVIYKSGIDPELKSLTIEGTGGGRMILSQGQDGLTAANGTIAKTGKGDVRESAGTQKFTQGLTIGDMGTAAGAFLLSNSATLTVGDPMVGGDEVIGNSGTGSFTQSDNSVHSVGGGLTLGKNTGGGNGTYNLEGGMLTTTVGTAVGDDGIGAFNQSAGTHTATGGLVLGRSLNGDGTYNLSGGTLSVGPGAGTTVGVNGTGMFVQTGGTHGTGFLELGRAAVSSGTYEFSSGMITVTTDLIVGNSGIGTFAQSGGTQTVGNNTTLGNSPTGFGTYNLNAGALNVGTETLGNSGTGIFNQKGGTHTVSGDLALALVTPFSSGTYNLSGGNLNVSFSEVLGNTGTGSFIQSGGTNVAGGLTLGVGPGSTGSYVLTGASVLTVNGSETVGNSGAGAFIQGTGADNPRHTISANLRLGDGIATGNYTLNSGRLTVTGNEEIGTFSTAVFTQMAGTHDIGGSLSLGVNIGNVRFGDGQLDLNDGTLTVAKDVNIGVSGAGRINANGGDMTVTGTITTKVNNGAAGSLLISATNVKAAKIVNNDSLGYFGGSLKADITNNAFFTLSGAGQRVVTGNITNTATGLVKVSNTKVKWDGNFMNNGAYKSEPSENLFSNLLIGTTGYLQGGSGDVFSISGNLFNTSTQNLNWQTDTAELTFVGTGPHHFDFNADDLGANLVGYMDNFAWGDFTLDLGTVLNVFDGNPNSSDTALYTTVFDIIGGNIGEVNYIDSDYNIYYDPTQAGNAYLDDKNYQLAGKGCLIAIGNFGACQNVPVPEPPALWPLINGLIGLLLSRRGFLSRQLD